MLLVLGLWLVYVNGLVSGEKEVPTTLDAQGKLLQKKLRSNELRTIAKDSLDQLVLKKGAAKPDLREREEAILFFRDIQAKGVILSLVGSEDLQTECFAVAYCLDVFGIEDLVPLYEATLKSAKPKLVTPGSDGADGGYSTAEELCIRFSRILGLGLTAPGLPLGASSAQGKNPIKDIQSWWTETLKKAKSRGTYQRDLLPAVSYFANQSRVPMNPVVANLDQHQDIVLKQLKNDWIKRKLNAKMEWLRPEPAGEKKKRREAVLFLFDIKATGMIARLLHSENKDLKDLVLNECLEVFGVKDVVSLYEGAAAHAKGVNANAADIDVIHKLAKRTAQILRLEPTIPKSAKTEDVRAWWAQAVRDAQTSGIYNAEIDAALKHVAKERK
jgi:hypothetical protein